MNTYLKFLIDFYISSFKSLQKIKISKINFILAPLKLSLFLIATFYISGFAQDSSMDDQLTIEAIECPGTPQKLCQTMLDKNQIEVGQIVDDKKINAMKMANLSIYSSMNIYLKKGKQKSQVVLVIDLDQKNSLNAEINTGTRVINNDLSQRISTRLIKQNLFGKGKIATLELDGVAPIENNQYYSIYSRLQYIDPYLFNRQDYFLLAGISLAKGKLDRDQDRFNWNSLGADFYLGKRLKNNSFITLGYTYAPISKTTRTTPAGIETFGGNHRVALSYGWDRKNDVYFPTRGSQFNTGIVWLIRGNNSFYGTNDYQLPIDYSVYWSKNNKTIWSFILGGNPGNAFAPTLEDNMSIALGVARDIKKNSKKTRLYLETGIPQGISYTVSSGNTDVSLGLKAGLKIKSKSLGMVNMYVFSSHDLEL